LTAAARTPSGGNLQPWNAYVVTGGSLDEVKKRIAERLARGDRGDECDFEMYPSELKSHYRQRRFAAGEPRYAALGIAREDNQSRQEAVAANWDCFGASTALFCYVDRYMGSAQWADIGTYLQTVMLLLRADGLHSCTQMAWSCYHRTMAEVLSPPPELILFCGMSIGFEDTTSDHLPIDRARSMRRSPFSTKDSSECSSQPVLRWALWLGWWLAVE
jgi:nitroreductase